MGSGARSTGPSVSGASAAPSDLNETPVYHPGTMRSAALRTHTAESILDSAAPVLAQRDQATMAELAEAAGVGRATLYRYFPTRDELVAALADRALEETTRRLSDAALDRVDVREAVARICRALLAIGDRYAVLVREGVRPSDGAAKRRIGRPMRAVIRRGIRDGGLRADIPVDAQVRLLGGMIGSAQRMVVDGAMGVEAAASMVTAVFIDGMGADA